MHQDEDPAEKKRRQARERKARWLGKSFWNGQFHFDMRHRHTYTHAYDHTCMLK